jgi:hypothetical protein
VFSHVHWLSVGIAALATFAIGGPWYSPVLFKTAWQREMGSPAQQPGHPARVFGLAYLFSFLSCALLAALLGAGADVWSGLRMGILVGACFVAASFGVNYQFAARSLKALLIDGGYHVVQFAAFGAILGAWRG